MFKGLLLSNIQVNVGSASNVGPTLTFTARGSTLVVRIRRL